MQARHVQFRDKSLEETCLRVCHNQGDSRYMRDVSQHFTLGSGQEELMTVAGSILENTTGFCA